jgi:hypothetical protein
LNYVSLAVHLFPRNFALLFIIAIQNTLIVSYR